MVLIPVVYLFPHSCVLILPATFCWVTKQYMGYLWGTLGITGTSGGH